MTFYVLGMCTRLISLIPFPRLKEHFLLYLEEGTNGVTFNPDDDGGEECNIITINVLPTDRKPSGETREMGWDVFDEIIEILRAEGDALWSQPGGGEFSDFKEWCHLINSRQGALQGAPGERQCHSARQPAARYFQR